MRLSRVKIENFRCFKHEEIIEIDNFTAFVGANSSGKTTFFNALLKLFGDSMAEREITRADFHVPYGVKPDTVAESKFSIEVVFEFNEVITKDGTERYTVPTYFNNFIIENDERPPYIRIRLEASWQKSNQPEGIVDSSICFIIAPEGTEPSDKHRKPISNAQLSLIKMIYVPALRNPASQLKMVSGTILWRLINRINFNEDFKTDISNQVKGVDRIIDEHKGISSLKKIMREEWKSYHNDERYKNIDLQFNTNDIESILKKIDPHFSPTEIESSYTVDTLGDGLRSLFYFSLVGSLLKTEEITLKEIADKPGLDIDERTFSNIPPCLTLVAVEEPENHVAPHMLGKIVSNLKKISTNSNSQVLMSSHTPAIIKRIEPTEIRHFRNCKDKKATVTNKILLPDKDSDAYKYVKEAVKSYAEIYFSSLVILGEGDSEEIIIPRVLDVIDLDMNTHEISIVPLGGRHVNHFWKLLSQLQIPFVTLLDLDLEREGGGWGRIKYAINQLISNGRNKTELLKLDEYNVLNDTDLEDMHKWSLNELHTNREYLDSWIKKLEDNNVFFSAPLDIDFLMIENYGDYYIKMLEEREGPRITELSLKKKIISLTEEDKKTEEYKTRLLNDIGCTLKDKNKKGDYYTEEQKELMIWYNYFFLNRGKPSTHITALSAIDRAELRKNLPNVFLNLSFAVKKQLGVGIDANE